MAARRPPRIAAIGLASWDTFLVVDAFPTAGSYAVVEQGASLPGGTTANSAVALARLGARVSLVSATGDDTAGRALRAALAAEGIDLGWLGLKTAEPTDRTTVVVSRRPPDRTIYWQQGARLVRGDRLDIGAIFEHDLVLVDADDLSLRRFLVDLPAHTRPAARLLGVLTYLADGGSPDAFDIALGHDALVGNERELKQITNTSSLNEAIARIQGGMQAANLRAGAISRGSRGATVFTREARWDISAFPVDVVDPTGAGDAFAAGMAYGMTLRWEWPRIAHFASAVGALSTRALGGQTALPTLDDVASLMEVDRATLTP